MIPEVASNREAWSRLSEEHYQYFKDRIRRGEHRLNAYIEEEIGDRLAGKRVLHLQCNTGADTLLLAQKAQWVTGVDLAPENVACASRMASELGCRNVGFVASDIQNLSRVHTEAYDVVFTSEGVLGWLPELHSWADTIRRSLRNGGYLYLFDSHPFFLSLDESRLAQEEYRIKYPYFGHQPDVDDSIGGYATPAKQGVKSYFWMHTFSEIFNSLLQSGLQIEYLHEFPENFYDSGQMQPSDKPGLFCYAYNTGKYPMSFSLKAVYPGDRASPSQGR